MRGLLITILVTAFSVGLSLPSAAAQDAPSAFSPEEAVAYSQAAVGRLVRDANFVSRDKQVVRLSDFRGKPLVVNLVFTACTESCPVVVQTLARAVQIAEDALGADGFSVVTIGFDSDHDTPRRMHAYAESQGIDAPNWRFLSADAGTIDRLLGDLGFVYFPSPRGFDHLAQTSVLDGDGRVYQQVYGDNFDPPALVEPLKSLAVGELSLVADLGQMIERVRLFCTFYDPSEDRYRLDYSFIIAFVVGGLSLIGMAIILVRAWLGARPPMGRA